MVLNFLGNGSGFSKSHTGAYFESNNNIYFFDCSMLNVHKMLELKPYEYGKCIIFITHMHDDHVSGLTLFLQFMHFVYDSHVYIYVPNNLINDLETDLKIKGISEKLYTIIDETLVGLNNFNYILTNHVKELDGKCFGYSMDIGNNHIVYSGDTNTLEPYKNYLTLGCEFYVDVSAEYGVVHLKYDDCKKELLDISKTSSVYIMHIDNEDLIKKRIEGTNIQIANIKNK